MKSDISHTLSKKLNDLKQVLLFKIHQLKAFDYFLTRYGKCGMMHE